MFDVAAAAAAAEYAISCGVLNFTLFSGLHQAAVNHSHTVYLNVEATRQVELLIVLQVRLKRHQQQRDETTINEKDQFFFLRIALCIESSSDLLMF